MNTADPKTQEQGPPANPATEGSATQNQDARRVLVMTSEIPWPLNTGGHLRTFHLLRSLASRFRVGLVAGVERADDAGIEVLRQHGIEVHAAVLGKRARLREAWRVANAAVHGEPYVMFRRHDRAPVRAVLQRVLKDCRDSVMYCDHLDPFALRSLFPAGAKLLVDMHNVYSTLTERVAEERTQWYARQYLAREARLLDQVERLAVRTADGVMAVSSQDQAKFESMGGRSVHLVPNGVDCDTYRQLPVGRPAADAKILFLGALSWQPNASAARFLAQRVLPEVRQTHPHAVVQIVGRNPGPAIGELAGLPGVEVHANVPDVAVYFRDATLLAVPLDSGGGTRLKILEAFAAGVPVVSTAVGCEGIDAIDGEHLTIRARDDFADGIRFALDHQARVTEIATAARELAELRYDWKVIGDKACDIVAAVLESRS